jgi:hypothetical protein
VPFNIVANSCTYTLSTMSQTISGGGGTNYVSVAVVGSNCANWTANHQYELDHDSVGSVELG